MCVSGSRRSAFSCSTQLQSTALLALTLLSLEAVRTEQGTVRSRRFGIGDTTEPFTRSMVCAGGAYVTGVFGRGGNLVDSIGVNCSDGSALGPEGGGGGNPYAHSCSEGFASATVCETQNGPASLSFLCGADNKTDPIGIDGCTSPAEFTCPPQQMLVGLNAVWPGSFVVTQLQLVCRDPPPVASPSYLSEGCFSSPGGSTLLVNSDTMTVATCAWLAFQAQLPYFGVLDGSHCYAVSEESVSFGGPLDNAYCSTPCPGGVTYPRSDSSSPARCGGPSGIISVYLIDSPPPPPPLPSPRPPPLRPPPSQQPMLLSMPRPPPRPSPDTATVNGGVAEVASKGNSGFPVGAVAGAVVGAVALALACLAVVVVRRRRQEAADREYTRKMAAQAGVLRVTQTTEQTMVEKTTTTVTMVAPAPASQGTLWCCFARSDPEAEMRRAVREGRSVLQQTSAKPPAAPAADRLDGGEDFTDLNSTSRQAPGSGKHAEA